LTRLVSSDSCSAKIADNIVDRTWASEKEPITPFVRIVRSLYDDCGISTILVVGGVGDYFDVAENVVVMDCYKCLGVTERAKQIVPRGFAVLQL
jgi:predicted ABC-class ATPase